MITIYQRNGSKLEPAFRAPSGWVRDWVTPAQPLTLNLGPQKPVTLECLWHNNAPSIVVVRGAENLECHPLVDVLQEGTEDV